MTNTTTKTCALRVIETRYKGYRFRSRLEARWAVYFDAEDIAWEYEPQGYDLDGVCYLPDFWLPQVSMFAEVKAGEFTPEELRKCRLLAEATDYRVLLLDGAPDMRSYFAMHPPAYWSDYGYAVTPSEPSCDYVVSSDHEYPQTQGRFFQDTGTAWPNPTRGWSWDFQRSVNAARGARFEHGEHGLGERGSHVTKPSPRRSGGY